MILGINLLKGLDNSSYIMRGGYKYPPRIFYLGENMMPEYTTWRNFDLTSRIAKLRGAFERRPVTTASDVPIVINTPYYFSFGSLDKPPDYYTNPASMLAYQTAGFEKHLSLVNDDLVPYLMPWFGTGVLASGFGTETRVPEDPSDDPAVAGPCIHSPQGCFQIKIARSISGWVDADQIGAQGYADSAVGAVYEAERLLKG